jgi:hypothetical protein
MNFKEFCEYFGHVVTPLTEALYDAFQQLTSSFENLADTFDDIQGPYKVVSPKNKPKFLVDRRYSSIGSNYNKPYVMMRNLPYQRRNY